MYLNLGLMKLFLKQMTNEKFEWSEVILYSVEVLISATDKYMLHKNLTKDWNTVHYVQSIIYTFTLSMLTLDLVLAVYY